ncbi:SulP family inorganic anion transporter [Schlesneria paludicola]|uniref:SulP family inorganic anion transporter n=1 Tax=Schlesneria paludicola TaxID=360056 RepID=UPI00029A4897|nr:SulP family inorganic anion transporter [Schlesneria paludicola]
MASDPHITIEKPQNGIAGLKHLRHDIVSGIVVSLVSLPLSSGIAIASGVPPIVGLISAIVAGFIFPFIGGAYMTIAGPAAGLAPAIMAVMISLGGAGDADHLGEGYHFLLVVIFIVGCLQVVLSLLKLARFAAIIPVTVVEGMLASIGLLIIVKQLPKFFGFTGKVHAHEFLEFVTSVPEYAQGMTTRVFAVALSSLVLLFVLGSFKKVRLLQVVPPQLVAVVFGVILGQFLNLGELGPGFMIKLPENPFHGIQSPDFGELLARSDLWQAAIVAVVMLTMIDGVESLATAMAIDRIDPFHRKSDANRVLLAMGVANVASSLVGGLTIIPGGVKSKANIAAGGRTLWANFTNAVCLVIYLLVGAAWINMIPLAVLASVLIYTGWKMCEPLVWRHVAHIGKEQVVIFSFTIAVTLLTDLLIGIAAGVLANFFLSALFCRHAIATAQSVGVKDLSLRRCLSDFFRNPVFKREYADHVYHMYVDKPLVCFNAMHLSEELDEIPSDVKSVQVHLEERVILVDHTAAENLMHAIKEYSHSNVPIEIVGLERLDCLSHYDACVRVATPVIQSA